MTIRLWDWEKGWSNTQVFEGHGHYVMQVKFNPRDSNIFASASLDRTIKVWSVAQQVPMYTLEGHEKGVNCLDYYKEGDKCVTCITRIVSCAFARPPSCSTA